MLDRLKLFRLFVILFLAAAIPCEARLTAAQRFLSVIQSSGGGGGGGNFIKTLGGIGGDGNSNSVAVDSSGNAYVVAIYTNDSANTKSVLDFSGAALNGVSGTSSADIVVAKLNSSGTQQWIKTLGGTLGEIAASVGVDSSGNVYVLASYFNSSANANSVKDFSGAALNGMGAASGRDIFVAKLNSSGTQQWIKTLGGTGTDTANAMAIDSSGNVYVIGTFSNSTTNPNTVKDFAAATLNGVTATTSNDIFVAKLDTSGTQQWIKTLGGTNADAATSIGVDSSGNVYATGGFLNSSANANSAKDFAAANLNGVTATASVDIFVAKLNSSGTQQWIKTLGGTSAELGGALTVDSSANVYVNGGFINTSANASGVKDFAGAALNGVTATSTAYVFAAMLNTSGTQQWIKTMGGTSTQGAGGIAVDSSGNSYVAGNFSNNSANANGVKDFAGATLNGATATTSTDAFVAKLNSSGTQQWIKTMGGVSNEGTPTVAVDSSGTSHVAGYYTNDSANVNSVKDLAGANLNGVTSTSSVDFYIQKVP